MEEIIDKVTELSLHGVTNLFLFFFFDVKLFSIAKILLQNVVNLLIFTLKSITTKLAYMASLIEQKK